MKDFLIKLLCVILGIALTIAVIMLLPYAIGLVIGLVLYPIELIAGADAALIILAVLLIVGLNVLSYFASYVWGQRKPWFFWVCLCLTIIVLFIAIDILFS